MEMLILIGLVSAVAAGLACAAEHGYAATHGWGPLSRYGAGALTWLVALVPVFVGAVVMGLIPLALAVLLYALAWLIIGGMAVGTAIAYRPPIAMPEDELETKINRALRKP